MPKRKRIPQASSDDNKNVKRSRSKSGYFGVYVRHPLKGGTRYQAMVPINGKSTSHGYHDTGKYSKANAVPQNVVL